MDVGALTSDERLRSTAETVCRESGPHRCFHSSGSTSLYFSISTRWANANILRRRRPCWRLPIGGNKLFVRTQLVNTVRGHRHRHRMNCGAVRCGVVSVHCSRKKNEKKERKNNFLFALGDVWGSSRLFFPSSTATISTFVLPFLKVVLLWCGMRWRVSPTTDAARSSKVFSGVARSHDNEGND